MRGEEASIQSAMSSCQIRREPHTVRHDKGFPSHLTKTPLPLSRAALPLTKTAPAPHLPDVPDPLCVVTVQQQRALPRNQLLHGSVAQLAHRSRNRADQQVQVPGQALGEGGTRGAW